MTTIPQSFAKLPGVSLRHRGKHTLELSEEVLLAIDFETFCRDLHVHDFLARSGEVVRYTTGYNHADLIALFAAVVALTPRSHISK